MPRLANLVGKSTFYSEIGYNYERAGGAQIPAPGRGWIWGLTEYEVSLFFDAPRNWLQI